jgi:hypothetical protein
MNHTDFNQIERSKLIQTDHTRFYFGSCEDKKVYVRSSRFYLVEDDHIARIHNKLVDLYMLSTHALLVDRGSIKVKALGQVHHHSERRATV